MSQYNIDNFIYNVFNQKNDGVFLEAGASSPDDQNNTFFLEKKGWTGLLVEPLTTYNESYKKIRPNSIVENYVLVDKSYTGNQILFGDHSHESGATAYHTRTYQTESKPCSTLDNLLRKHAIKHIDFFSLDTEGFEHYVLHGIDFSYTTFNIILIEQHFDAYKESNFIKTPDFSYLNKHGYIQYKNNIPLDHTQF